jgi:hypothetical protein
MTRKDFKACVQRARIDGFNPNFNDLAVFEACALDKRRRFVTFDQVASFIVYHCYTFAGTWDYSELNNLEYYSKRWDLID